MRTLKTACSSRGHVVDPLKTPKPQASQSTSAHFPRGAMTHAPLSK